MTGTIRYARKVSPKTGEWCELPEFYIDGKRVTRRAFRKAFPDGEIDGTRSARPKYPMVSEAMGVSPRQVEAANARNKAHGVGVRYDPKTGNAVIPSPGEYKKLRRISGVHFKNAFYD